MSLWDSLIGIRKILRDGVELLSSGSLDVVGPGLAAEYNSATQRVELSATAMGTTRVRMATTAALAANTRTGNTFTANANGVLAAIDGVTPTVGDLFLDRNHATGANRGVMIVVSVGSVGSQAQWARASIADSDEDIRPGMGLVFVEEGAANGNSLFALTPNGVITLNVTSLVFAKVANSGAGGVPIPADPGDDGEILYASASAYALASTVKTDGASISIGATPATSGAIRMTNNEFINFRSSGGTTVTGIGMSASNRISIGSSSSAIVAQDYGVGTGGSFNWSVAGVAAASLSGTSLSLPFGGTAASAGSLRLVSNATVQWRDAGNTANMIGIQYSAQTLILGQSTICDGIIYSIATGSLFDWRINNATIASLDANVCDLRSIALRFGTANFATIGTIRFTNGFRQVARNAGNTTNVGILELTASDVLQIGLVTSGVAAPNMDLHVASAGTIGLWVAGVSEYVFDASRCKFAAGNVLQFGATTQTGGRINVDNGVSIIEARNAANSANLPVLSTSGDTVLLGGNSDIANIQIRVPTASQVLFYINAVAQGNWSSTGLRLDTAAGTSAAGARLDIRSAIDEQQIRLQQGAGQTTPPIQMFAPDGTTLQFSLLTSGSIALSATANNSIFKTSSLVIGTGFTFTITGQDFTGSGAGTHTAGAVTLRGGDATGATATHVGGLLTLRGGDASGGSGTRTGGGLDIRAGTGATANGELRLLDNATPRIRINATGLAFFNAAPVAQQADMVAITDNTGGGVSTTFAAITAGAGYTQADMTAVKNALASTAAQLNKVRTALRNLGLMA
jgi:hypothetical protein